MLRARLVIDVVKLKQSFLCPTLKNLQLKKLFCKIYKKLKFNFVKFNSRAILDDYWL